MAVHEGANGKTDSSLIDSLVKERVRSILEARVSPYLRETFTPNDPVHGLMHLPAIVEDVVDTLTFQRMRHIKQLGISCLVNPGATHNRFFHSIGTCFLAHELIKGLRLRQPELGITDRDMLCVSLAGLCHDLGHPAYSHMFEHFVHGLGRDRRRELLARAAAEGRAPTAAEEAAVAAYETWTHESASVFLLSGLFEELKDTFAQAGLTRDELGDDFACISELIDPPKNKLEELGDAQQLREKWPSIIKGRPVAKAWMYEIVSNWRSGIDVDKFDYFRRDAFYLGIHRQFDHERYMKGIKVLEDAQGVPTLSPPEKDKDLLRDSMMELRKYLHRSAYHHKTVKKLELHMVDVLRKMDEVIRITGVDGRKLRISEAAVLLDPVAYPKLTDTFVEARLLDREDTSMKAAADDYERHILRRHMMRLIADWDLPREHDDGRPFLLPTEEHVLRGVLKEYRRAAAEYLPDRPIRDVPLMELRTQMAKIHYGMGSSDPITRIVFHNPMTEESRRFALEETKPLRQKVFLFWNPSTNEDLKDQLTLTRLMLAFRAWADKEVNGEARAIPSSPSKAQCRRAAKRLAEEALQLPVFFPAPASAEAAAEAMSSPTMSAPTEVPMKRPRRLKARTSSTLEAPFEGA